MAAKILIRKRRYTGSDVQREKLQRQISNYAALHRAEQERLDVQAARARAAQETSMPDFFTGMQSWIEQTIQLVEERLAVTASGD